jgi:CheY-like chemotaxis protein
MGYWRLSSSPPIGWFDHPPVISTTGGMNEGPPRTDISVWMAVLSKLERSSRTILYIEDHAGSRELVETLLDHSGERLLLAKTGTAGLELARKEVPDLILLDLHLPDIDTPKLVDFLKADETTRAIPIIALTGEEWDERTWIRELPLAGYIKKPLDDFDAFYGLIERCLERPEPSG